MELNDNVLFSVTNYAEQAKFISNLDFLSGYEPEKCLIPNTYESSRFLFPSSTTTTLTLKLALNRQKPVNVVALCKINLTQLSQWSIVLKDREGGSTLYSSGLMNVFIATDGYAEDAWGTFNWGALVPAEDLQDFSVNALHPLDESYTAGYMEINIVANDTTLPYFETFLIWAGDGYQPERNANYGAEIYLIEETKFKQADSGSRSYGSPIRRRGISLELVEVEKDEMFAKVFGPILQAKGMSKLALVVMTPTDLNTLGSQSLLGNLTNPQKVTHAVWNRLNVSLEYEESP